MFSSFQGNLIPRSQLRLDFHQVAYLSSIFWWESEICSCC